MKRVKKILFFMVLFTVLGIVSFVVFNPWEMGFREVFSLSFPKIETKKAVNIPSSYFVDLKDNRVYLQGKNQCGAFSSSFVLRNLGVDVYGESIYKKMNPKLKNGYLLPKAITKFFKEQGFNAVLKKGDLTNLKQELLKGNPVIALIGDGFKFQHYIVVTGYDKNNIYTVDSLVSQGNFTYNKKYSNEEFLKLWKNKLPIFNSLYIGID